MAEYIERAFPFLADFECQSCGEIARHDPGCPHYVTETAMSEPASAARCKVDGCTNAAAATRGRYAMLCQEHRAARQLENGHGAIDGGIEELVVPVDEPPAESDLVRAARDVDAAAAALAQAKLRLYRLLDEQP